MQKLQPIAMKLIAGQNKSLKEIEPAGWVADRVPSTGLIIYKFNAITKNKPNGPIHSVVIDEQGKMVNLKALEKREDAEFFASFPLHGAEQVNPAVVITPFRDPVPPAVHVTISPNVNNLQLTPGQVFTEDIHVTTPAVPEQLYDVYFLADTTGSMTDIIDAVKSGATNIVSTLQAQFPTMAFGVGNYKDFNSGDPYCFLNQQACTTTASFALTAINAWNASGGSDGSEGQLFALNQIATSSGIWRSGAKRIVVWFGDAPGHDPVCAGLPGVPTAITEAIATSHLVTAAIRVIAISTVTGYPQGLDDNPNGSVYDYPCTANGVAGQATRIATTTGGSYIDGVNSATICSAISDGVVEAANLFDNIHLVASGGIAPFVTSITPAAGYGPVSGSTSHDYVFHVTFTGPPCGDTDHVFTGTIDVIGDGHVVAHKDVILTAPACARWSYGVKFLCGSVKEASEGEVSRPAFTTLRPGMYATDINILNHNAREITVHKYLYLLVHKTRVMGREPRYVKPRFQDVITLPGHSATFDDCYRLHELMHETGTADEPCSIGFLEIVSPVELTVTAVYTASDLQGTSTDLEVVQIEGRKILNKDVIPKES